MAAIGAWAGAPAAAALGEEERFAPEAAEFAPEAAVLATFFGGPSSSASVCWGFAPAALQEAFAPEAGGLTGGFCGDAFAIATTVRARHQLRAH